MQVDNRIWSNDDPLLGEDMLKLYTDAATKGNTGIGGVGVLIVNDHDQVQLHLPLPAMTNHEAEFHAALAGFDYLLAHQLNTGLVSYATDSKLVLDALDKRYAKHYPALLAALLERTDRFPNLITQWVPDRVNQGAHQLAQLGLREAEQQ